jgi:molybdopterin synthase catalytic subunit
MAIITSTGDQVLVEITSEPLALEKLISFVSGEECGAIVTFAGLVRATEQNRNIEALEYEYHPEMAIAQLRTVVSDALTAHDVQKIACIHRTGRVPAGEASVLIAVGSRHRAAAIDACTFVIDELKKRVPIWKSAIPAL